MTHYTICGIDNRGTDDTPFGRVYLYKGSNEVGSLGYGAHRGNPDPLAIWPSNQTPEDTSPITLERAREYLKRFFPKLAKGA